MQAEDYTGRGRATAIVHKVAQNAESTDKGIAVCGLLAGALVWGLIWYPFRVLRDLGVAGEISSVIAYGIALLLSAVVYRRQLGSLRPDGLLLLIAFAIGVCNVGFVLATMHGQVMRVVLLFYLAPMWTVIFAYVLLGERLSLQGGALMLLALAGAMVMLWNPALGMPLPSDAWEWVALAMGVLFAFTNVLLRKAKDYSIEHKSFYVFAGCTLAALLVCLFQGAPVPAMEGWNTMTVGLMLLVGIVMWSVNYAVQFGLGRVPANQAIVIYLSELVFAAAASWILAGEVLSAKEWTGGAMIIGASLLSGRLRPPAVPEVVPAAASAT
jgi:drug/metabolite transporter (DMT)-like permease